MVGERFTTVCFEVFPGIEDLALRIDLPQARPPRIGPTINFSHARLRHLASAPGPAPSIAA